MLSELVVEGIGVIDRAELHLNEGSSALTGETGAGKTLLVAALGLLRGVRADRTLVRQGASQARAEARFLVPRTHPVVAVVANNDLTTDDDDPVELVLARVVGADGRSKARINGSLVALSLLEQVGSGLIEIAGQAEHHTLATSSAQRDALDAFAGPDAVALATRLRTAYEELSGLRAELDALRSSERDRQRDIDVLRFEIGEIEAVAPRIGESEEIKLASERLEHAEQISSSIDDTVQLLHGDAGVEELLAQAVGRLGPAADRDPAIAPLIDRLTSADIEIRDIVDDLTRGAVPADPSALAALRARADELARLRRKYGPDEAEVLSYLERSHERLRSLEASDQTADAIQARLEKLQGEAGRQASQLSEIRRVAAGELATAVEGLLADLALTDARFEVELEPVELCAGGTEHATFLFAANPGEAPKPLGKVASGGELSRVALALRLLTSIGSATTVVFDEVDAGVGGEAARAVGRCLADLGHRRTVQALVVTHLPQVAAFADHQYRVTKGIAGDRSASEVVRVEGEARVAELSRMLAGLPGSERARDHAEELLEVAARETRSR